jgi:carnitine O-acetyltransferase
LIISLLARLPPDAYTQLALQLAWYRSRGFLTATYETALTRMFDAGRTECVRSASVEGLDFVQAAKEWGRGAERVVGGGQNEVEVNSFSYIQSDDENSRFSSTSCGPTIDPLM